MKEPWYESSNPDRIARSVGWRAAVWVVLAVLLVGAISIGIWGFKVATSDVKGQGDATRTKNSGTNRIAAQERFEDLHQDILVADKRIDVMADALKRDPKSPIARTNLTGAVTYCQQVVGDYNAEARKYTSADFRAIDLPPQIDDLDTNTDCKETS